VCSGVTSAATLATAFGASSWWLVAQAVTGPVREIEPDKLVD
jgi:hypothetical protein